jgi:hypothetical protein
MMHGLVGCSCTLVEAPRGPFIVPKGLGAVGASFGSSQPSLFAGCTGLSGVPPDSAQ